MKDEFWGQGGKQWQQTEWIFKVSTWKMVGNTKPALSHPSGKTIYYLDF